MLKEKLFLITQNKKIMKLYCCKSNFFRKSRETTCIGDGEG